MSSFSEHFLGLGNCSRRIQSLRAGASAVHDRVTTIQAEWILEIVESFAGGFVAAVDQPAIRRQDCRRSEETITVPPVAWATGRTTGTENTGGRFVYHSAAKNGDYALVFQVAVID